MEARIQYQDEVNKLTKQVWTLVYEQEVAH